MWISSRSVWIFFCLLFAFGAADGALDPGQNQIVEPIRAASAETLLYSKFNLLLLEPLQRSRSYWLQIGVGGTLYDARREVLMGRWSSGVQIGRRRERWGYFLNVALDRSYDLTQETRVLDVVHVGPGVEGLQYLGHVRSSLSMGIAFLRSDTEIDNRGKTGWYVDLRPASLRWGWGRRGVIEFTPLAMNVSVPVTKGIPLVLFSYMTVFAVEWADEGGENAVSLL